VAFRLAFTEPPAFLAPPTPARSTIASARDAAYFFAIRLTETESDFAFL
jgi:hypothetical protein